VKKIVIIGAGLTGLSVAYHLEPERTKGTLSYDIIEKCDRPGGLCKTEEENGYQFDYTGHLLHFRTPYFQNLVKRLLSGNLETIKRSAWIYSQGVYTAYPFQANLYGLPEKIAVECLYEYCRAYFKTDEQEIKTFYDWITMNFGSGVARHFMVPYNRKLWLRHPKDMNCDWVGRFVPKPDLKEVIRGTIRSKGKAFGYNANFYYPKEGGIESLIRSLAKGTGTIHTKQEVNRINLKKRKIYTSRGTAMPFDVLVSTIPITDLVSVIDSAPAAVREAAKKLNHVSVLNINFGLKKKIQEKHWVYIPERKFLFYRMGFPHNFSPKTAMPSHSSIYTEISYDPGKGIDAERVKSKVIKDLKNIGIIRDQSDIVAEKTMDIPCAYVIYDTQREPALSLVQDYLKKEKVFSIGRYGDWKYSTMEDAVLDGQETAMSVVFTVRNAVRSNGEK
jgi:protoporphyrinogen oxidase